MDKHGFRGPIHRVTHEEFLAGSVHPRRCLPTSKNQRLIKLKRENKFTMIQSSIHDALNNLGTEEIQSRVKKR